MGRFFLPTALFLLLWTAVSACDTTPRKLDEVLFYEGPQFSLKLVRYHEHLPFHYKGEIFVVQCRSPQTHGYPAQSTQDRGWRSLGRGGAIGTNNAEEVADRESLHYLVVDPTTLVWTGTVFQISFDACGHFSQWDPTTLSDDLILPVEKPSYCAPEGTGDCRYYDFQGDRKPQFEDIQISPRGTISFLVRSKSFKPTGVLKVRSEDQGRTWNVEVEFPSSPVNKPNRPENRRELVSKAPLFDRQQRGLNG